MTGITEMLDTLSIGISAGSEQTYDVCPDCGGTGFITWRENGILYGRECRCEVRRRNHLRIERSGLKPLLESCTFERFKTGESWQAEAKQKAESFAADCRGKWFFIGGSPGTGKTHLCTAICGKLMDAGLSCRYVQWRADIPAVKAMIKDPEEYRAAIWPLKAVRVLYIDDFLKGSITDADKNIAFDLLGCRYNDPNAITVISTELPIDRILSWDEAIGSRIAERAKDYTLNLRNKQNWRLR